MAVTFAWACWSVTPGFSRAATRYHVRFLSPRLIRVGSSSQKVILRSNSVGSSSLAGRTPTIVTTLPSSRTVRPTIFGSAP